MSASRLRPSGLVGLILVIGLMVVGGSFFYDRPSQEAYRYNRHIPALTADETAALLHPAAPLRGRLLFIFTSWCPYCKKQFPVMLELAQAYHGASLDTTLLSVDRDRLKLAEFMVSQHPQSPLTPVILHPDARDDLATALYQAGSSFRGGIPYVALLSPSGKVVAEFAGMVDKQTLAARIDAALAAEGRGQ